MLELNVASITERKRDGEFITNAIIDLYQGTARHLGLRLEYSPNGVGVFIHYGEACIGILSYIGELRLFLTGYTEAQKRLHAQAIAYIERLQANPQRALARRWAEVS